MENTPMILRMITEPKIVESVEISKKLIVPHHKYLSEAKVVKGIAREVLLSSFCSHLVPFE